MTTFFNKHWALIGFILAFLLDAQFGFVAAIAPNEQVALLIHGVGAILLGYFWKTENIG